MSTFVPSYPLLQSIGAVALSSLVIGCLAEPDEVIDESTEIDAVAEADTAPAPKATGPLGGATWSTVDALCTHAGAKVYTGDFNGDGRDDLLCHDTNGGTWIDYADVSGRFGTHDTFVDVNFCTALGNRKLRLGDFNADGLTDLMCRSAGGTTWIDYNDAGRFAGTDWSADLDMCQHTGAKVYIGDTNADGRDDLLCHDTEGRIWIDRATPTGRFDSHDWFLDTNFCTHHGATLLLEDVSGDGRRDLVCHDDAGRTWVDRASPTGTYAPHDFFSDEFCEGSSVVYPGRFSSDGRVDLLCHGQGTLTIAYSGL